LYDTGKFWVIAPHVDFGKYKKGKVGCTMTGIETPIEELPCASSPFLELKVKGEKPSATHMPISSKAD
jgi:hypothetical protein